MKRDDMTDMGGAGEAFLTTHWSIIDNVSSSDDDKNQALIGLLLDRYWKPVYCYLRRKGHDNEQAKDLTQGFFHEVVLTRNLIGRADSTKGRFRTFLLHALNQYLADEQRKEAAHGVGDEMDRAVWREMVQGGDQIGESAAGAQGGLQRTGGHHRVLVDGDVPLLRGCPG